MVDLLLHVSASERAEDETAEGAAAGGELAAAEAAAAGQRWREVYEAVLP
eukprot:SAG11_NODE_14361_length_615_cov_0.775194_1_plen_49_part_10